MIEHVTEVVEEHRDDRQVFLDNVSRPLEIAVLLSVRPRDPDDVPPFADHLIQTVSNLPADVLLKLAACGVVPADRVVCQ